MSEKWRTDFRGAKHREEAAKLAAVLFNGVAIACLIGASFGPLLNTALAWGWRSLALFLAAILIHAAAQAVLMLGYPKEFA